MSASGKKDFTIRSLEESDLDHILTVAQEVKWPFSVREVRAWYAVQPDGFLVLDIDGEFIGCINVINLSPKHAYIGTYVVKKEYRCQGYGNILWQEGLKRAGTRSLVVNTSGADFAMYKRKGFNTSANQHRMKIMRCTFNTQGADENVQVSRVKMEDAKRIADYDARYYTVIERRDYIREWILIDGFISLVAKENDTTNIVGFLVAIHHSKNTYRVTPMVADSLAIAKSLTKALVDLLPEGASFRVEAPAERPDVDQLFAEIEYVSDTYYFMATGDNPRPNEDKFWFLNATYPA